MKKFYSIIPKELYSVLLFLFYFVPSYSQITFNSCDQSSSTTCPEVTTVVIANLMENVPGPGLCTYNLEISYIKNSANNSSLAWRIDTSENGVNPLVTEGCYVTSIGQGGNPDFGTVTYIGLVTDCAATIIVTWSGHTNPSCGGNCCGRMEDRVQVQEPLPVELAAFTGAPKFGMVELSWVTESETDNDRFDVQRSRDGSKFETIGEVAGHGTSTAVNFYTYMDKEALPFAYYRLKQMDQNGDFDYSPIISVQRKGVPGKLMVYPSQAKEEITIRMETTFSRKSVLRITNTQGQLLKSLEYDRTNGTEYLRVDVSNYSPGIYYVTLTQEKETISSKFIVVED